MYICFSGEFHGGGSIAVECSPFQVAHVDTKGRFGKVDGRWPHWVTEYEGTRYSLIYVSYLNLYAFIQVNDSYLNNLHFQTLSI